MLKRAVVLGILAIAFALYAAGMSAAQGEAVCTIVKVENNVVTLDCGNKAKKLHAGRQANVRELPEGC